MSILVKISTSISKVKPLWLFLFVLAINLSLTQAENCRRYRAKTDSVPVYSKPSLDSSRGKPLSLGEEVCYVGEVSTFAIIDLDGFKNLEGPIERSRTAYVQLHDLWEPAEANTSRTKKQKVESLVNNWQNGGVPDDPSAPFRSLFGIEQTISCKAGKICEKVAEKLKEQEKSAQD